MKLPSGEPAASDAVHPLIDLPFRVAGAAAGGWFAWDWLSNEGFAYTDLVQSRFFLIVAIGGVVAGWILAPFFSSRPYFAVLAWLRTRGPYPLYAGALGTVAGLAIAWLLAALLPQDLNRWLPLALGLLFAPLGAIAFAGHPGLLERIWRSVDRTARRTARATGRPRIPALRAAPLRRRRR